MPNDPASDPNPDNYTAAPLPQAPLDDRQRLACLRLIRTDGIGPVLFRELVNRYGGADKALEALPDLAKKSGRARPFRITPRDVAEAELDAADKIGAVPLFTIEPHYPALLAHLDTPPPMIYVKGRLELLARNTVAMVGSRDASAAGRKFARQLASELSAASLVIVSGLARGIDSEAHAASLNGGTIAVLAGGVDNVYPPENSDLHARIGTDGCIVSDRPPGFSPRGQDFPRRNRIISGLSYAVVVVEAARRSGTLITARFANEQGRQVFAVPGHPLDPRAEGTNELLREGASLVIRAEDVLAGLQPVLPQAHAFRDTTHRLIAPSDAQPPMSSGKETAGAMPETSPPPTVADGEVARVLAALGPMPVETDELVRVTGLPIRAIHVALVELDLAGHIERHGHQLVSRRSD